MLAKHVEVHASDAFPNSMSKDAQSSGVKMERIGCYEKIKERWD